MRKTTIWLVLALMLLSTIDAEDNLFIGETWKAGHLEQIRIETDNIYDSIDIEITDWNNTLVEKGIFSKEIEGIYAFYHYLPSNQKADKYNIHLKFFRGREYYADKSFQIEVEEMNLFEKVWLFLKTNLPFL